jgi:glycosyltransferase involved in cell wall biosynthesis
MALWGVLVFVLHSPRCYGITASGELLVARIFFAAEWIKNNVKTPDGMTWHDTSHTGYGGLRSSVRKWADLRGHELLDEPEGCDVEFHVGDCGVKPDPHIHPSVIMTMFELTRFPYSWVENLPNFDLVALPSKWCVDCYTQQFAEVGREDINDKVRYVKLGIRTEDFPFTERTSNSPWTILCQAVELRDRKGLLLVKTALDQYRDKLPSDLNVRFKILPVGPSGVLIDGYEFELYNGKLRLTAKVMDRDDFLEYLNECDYSVNPTAGEGFGLIPLEHMSLGMGVAVTFFSGVMDYAHKPLFRPIKHQRVAGQLPMSEIAAPNVRSIFNSMIWSYEHQDEVRAIGRNGSQWVQDNWPIENMYQSLDDILAELLTIPCSVNTERKPVEYEYNADFIMTEERVIARR